MAIRIREWTQYEWQRVGRSYYAQRGDLDELSGLFPSTDGRSLQRAPSWSSHVAFPSGFTRCQGAFYDWNQQRYVFIGRDASDQLVSCYANNAWSFSSVYTLVASSLTLGGIYGQNVAYWGGDLYVIGSDGDVYRGSSYTSALSSFYTGGDARALTAFGDRMYLATTTGDVLRLDDADSAFESYFSPVGDLNIRFMAPFRGYLLIVTRSKTGELLIHRLPPDTSSPSLDTIAQVPPTRGDNVLAGLLATRLFALHDDALYLSPGRDTLLDGSKGLNLYRFNGSQVELVGSQPMPTASPVFFGLTTWRHHLALFDIAASSQAVQLLVGDKFADCLPSLSDSLPTYSTLFSLGGDLVILTEDALGNEGVKYQSATALEDGYLVTPYLDMGSPSTIKRLERITALISDAASSFQVIIKYRTDDNTAWTTATTANNTRRPTVGDLGDTFYTLQVRVDIDDDTGNDEDFRINGLSVLYSINT